MFEALGVGALLILLAVILRVSGITVIHVEFGDKRSLPDRKQVEN